MQTTMVRGREGKWSAGEKNKNLKLGEKNEKGKEKRRKITLKKGEIGLKNASLYRIYKVQ